VYTTTEPGSDKQPELVKFQIKAVFRNPADAAAPPAAADAAAASPQLKAQG
jgi:hypothetical protein